MIMVDINLLVIMIVNDLELMISKLFNLIVVIGMDVLIYVIEVVVVNGVYDVIDLIVLYVIK